MLSLREQEKRLTRRLKLLIVALVLTAVPLAIALAVLPRLSREIITSLGEARLEQIAEDLASFTQKTMEHHLETMRAMGTLPSIRNAILHHNANQLTPTELDAVNGEIRGFIQQMDTEPQGIFVCGQNGISFAGTLQSGDTRPYAHLDVSDRSYFADAKRTLQPLISDPLCARVSGLPIVAVVAPIPDEKGGFAGMLVMSLKIQHLSDLIATRKIGLTGYPFAIDRYGILVAHPDSKRFFSDSLINHAQADRLVKRMQQGEHGIEPYVSSLGAKKMGAFAPAPICGWSICASIEIAEYEAPVQRIRLILSVLLCTCILIGLVIAGTIYIGLKRLNLALAEARASDIRFRLVANIAGGAVWDWNLDTGEMWWNDGLTTTFGWKPQQITTFDTFIEHLLPAECNAVRNELRSCIVGGAWTGEHHFPRIDGTSSYIIHRAAAIKGPGGKAVRIIGSITDITERRANERKIAEQAELLNQTRDSIILQDLNHTIRFWNTGAQLLYGWSAPETSGRRHDELLGIDAGQYAEANRAVRANGTWVGRLRKVTKMGQARTIECRWTLLLNEQRQPSAILSLGTDVTDRLVMEEKFLRTQRLESIGTLAGGIAHDLNNLLSPILAGTGMLRTESLSKDQGEIVDVMEQSARRGATLVKQVLTFARGVKGSLVSVHAGFVLREVEAIVSSTFPKNITLQTKVMPGLHLVHADPTQLHQVFLNLCVNARDAMPDGGLLSVEVLNVDIDSSFAALNSELCPGPHVCIVITDTGTGIPAELRVKIFEPFFTTKGPNKGSGLGLSTVIGIVRSFGGMVSVDSEVGKGSVFRIYIPANNHARGEATDVASKMPLKKGSGELVLLVDDELLNIDFGKRVLEANGYRVLVARDGAAGLQLYHEHRDDIALLLTDMMMPRMDGRELIMAIRQGDSQLPIVVMSGLGDFSELKSSGLSITNFLAKPFTVSTLLGVVHAVARKS